jgi:hypothetical protein
MSDERPDDIKAFDRVTMPAALVSCSGILLFVWQIATWLKAGVWDAWPIARALFLAIPAQSDFARWYVAPHDWHGLHRLFVGLLNLPLSATLFFAGVGLFALVEGPARTAQLRVLRRRTIEPKSRAEQK